MSEDNKTEKPTPKKIKDARKKGNVGYSKDISTSVCISTAFVLIFAMKNNWLLSLTTIWNNLFKIISSSNLESSIIILVVEDSFSSIVWGVYVVILIIALVTMMTTIIQYGGVLVTDKLLKFDLQKFNFAKNLQQIFSKKNFTKFIFNCLKIVIMICISFFIFERNLSNLFLLSNLSIPDAVASLLTIMSQIMIPLGLVFFVFGAIDLFLEKRSVMKQLMMSMEDLKREYKESEGDPEIKHQRKELHRELLEDDGGSEHTSGSFVLANPTHIAILIMYKPTKWALPVVLSKEKGINATKVFEYAKKRSIPIIREKWLARKLFDIAKVKEFIPASLVTDIAELIVKNIDILPTIKAEIESLKKQPIAAVDKPTPITKSPIS